MTRFGKLDDRSRFGAALGACLCLSGLVGGLCGCGGSDSQGETPTLDAGVEQDGSHQDGATGDGGSVGRAPVATDDEASTSENVPVDIDVLDNDSDSDGDQLIVQVTDGPSHGQAAVTDAGEVHYQPAVGFTGTDTFQYSITEPTGLSASANVRVSVSSDGMSLYVAPDGDDAGTGSVEKPFATLEAARDAIGALESLPSGGVTVWLRDGVYELGSSFVLTEQDSGTKDSPITYRGVPGEEARLIGARRLDVSGFHEVTDSDPVYARLLEAARGKVVELDVSGLADKLGHLSTRGFGGWKGDVAHAELFFDGKPMQLARWPDADDDDPWSRIDKARGDTQFTYTGDRPKRWTHAKDIWLHGYWKYMWADLYAHVVSIDMHSRTVTLASKPGYGIADGQPYYAVNLLEEISEPGEWYVDRDAAKLYFWPPSSLTSPGVEVALSVLDEPLVKLKGASWIRFTGLTIEMGRDSLVNVSGGSHNRVDHCLLRDSGRKGVIVDGGEDNGVERCEIVDTGDHGVLLKGGDREKLQRANNFVRNCHIHRFSRWSWTYTPGVLVYDVGNIVEHNLIEDAPHTAILFSGNEHEIRFNHIRHVLRWSSDAGAIYTGRDWGFRNNHVEFNFIHDVDSEFEGFGTHGIYLDDCVSGITVKGNILYKISGYGIEAGGGRDNTIVNNVIVGCGKGALSADSRGIKRITHDGSSWDMLKKLNDMHYREDPWKTAYPRLAVIPNDWSVLSDPSKTWLYPEGCVFSRNLGFDNSRWIREYDYGGTGTMNKWKVVKDNIENEDPHFVDEANGDMSLAPDSPAYTIPGFEPIPFDQIGILPEH